VPGRVWTKSAPGPGRSREVQMGLWARGDDGYELTKAIAIINAMLPG
jgi:hypothetical protein